MKDNIFSKMLRSLKRDRHDNHKAMIATGLLATAGCVVSVLFFQGAVIVAACIAAPFYASLIKWVATSKKDEKTLAFEEKVAVLEGNRKDVARVKSLDAEIGSLMKSFNGIARLPDDVLAEINLHIQDVSPSLKRVAAFEPKTELEETGEVLKEMFGASTRSEKDNKGTPLSVLEYCNDYTSASGVKYKQQVAQIRL
jgi:hypothetical protein